MALERLRERLPTYLTGLLEAQHCQLNELDNQISGIDKQLTAVAKQNKACERLLEIPGIGPLIATAVVATMGEASAFRSGRKFSAFLGLVPGQTSSGGKVKLLGISKRGDTYLRTFFIHGARSASMMVKKPGPWIKELKVRYPASVAIVAMANKLARTVWALVAHSRSYAENHVSIKPY